MIRDGLRPRGCDSEFALAPTDWDGRRADREMEEARPIEDGWEMGIGEAEDCWADDMVGEKGIGMKG